jgi:hypothetical protein
MQHGRLRSTACDCAVLRRTMVLIDPRHRRGSSRRESQMGLIGWYLSLGEYWYLSQATVLLRDPPVFFWLELFKVERRDKRFN